MRSHRFVTPHEIHESHEAFNSKRIFVPFVSSWLCGLRDVMLRTLCVCRARSVRGGDSASFLAASRQFLLGGNVLTILADFKPQLAKRAHVDVSDEDE